MLWSRRLVLVVLGATLACGGLAAGFAQAADKPEIGPPEAWVRAAPRLPEPLKSSAGAALSSLVSDQQEHFDGQSEAFYTAYQIKVQTAEGLQAMGTVDFQWSPETDRLVLHRVRILRGDQVIEALPKDGAFTIARREDKLDSEGQLNGVLTVILPIEGLQVGDVVDVAYTLHHVDPLLKGRVDRIASLPNGAPIAFARIRISWPQSTPVRWRASSGMPEPRVTNLAGFTEAEMTAEGVMPLIKPKGAPARFQRDRELAVSSYLSWSEVSSSLAPLYAKAMQVGPNSPVRSEAAAIAARSADPAVRAGAALALVEDKIRYLAQTLGEGGLKPVSADDTWAHRYGDCKAKTALLLALLSELGIKAEPVLVSTELGEDLDTRLPGLSYFDHVMVHTVIGGRDYWLDGTRSGDASLAALETPGYGFVLPLQDAGAALVKLVRTPLLQPELATSLRLDLSKGIDAPATAHAEAVFRGDWANATRLNVGAMTPDDRDRALRAYWRKVFDFMTVSSASIVFDAASGEARLAADGEATLDWSGGGYELDGAVIGLKPDIDRDPASTNPGAPFVVQFPFYTTQDLTMVLPDHGQGFVLRGNMIDRELGGYAFKREAEVKDGVLHMHTSMRSLVPEIAYADEKAAAEPMAAMAKTTLRLRPPPASASAGSPTDQPPKTAGDYIVLGNTLLDARRYREALKDYDEALKLDPKSGAAMADRALAHVGLGETTEALSDADQAELLNSREPAIYRARGLLAEEAGNWPEALANFTRSVDLDPSAFGYFHRARAYLMVKDYPRALRDYDAELAAAPGNLWPHISKAEVYLVMKQPDKARLEVDAVKAASIDDADLRAARFSYLIQLGDRKTARDEADAAIAAHPSAKTYLQRIRVREPDDLAGGEADAGAAYTLDPKSTMAMRYLAAYRMKAKDYAAAADWSERAHALQPDDLWVLIDRAEARLKLGRLDAARADFAAVRSQAKTNALLLNEICYRQATSNFDLDTALADCNASLALEKVAHTFDSRAFVLLRLGRNKDALADFDQALADAPDLAPSLYGRSLAERRLGDAAAADRDRAAALAKAPKVADAYTEYGLTQ